MANLLSKLTDHGPIGLFCVALLLALVACSAAIVTLWRRNAKIQDDLYKLAIDKVRTDEKVHITLRVLLDKIEDLRRAPR